MSALPYALKYAQRGWNVLPLNWIDRDGCSCRKPGCQSPGKHPFYPLAPNGLKQATTDRATIAAWFRRYPDLNLGIRTGAMSGLVVIDIDVDHDGDISWRDIEERYGRHTPTLGVMTGGGGQHLYFAHPGHEIRNSAGTLGQGVDVRGDGGFVVAPPSVHASGGVYQWDWGNQKQGDIHLAPLPPWAEARAIPVSTTPKFRPGNVVMPGKFPPIPEGQRNVALASIAGRARRQGADDEEVLEIVEKANQQASQVPLPDREVQAIAKSISRYERGA